MAITEDEMTKRKEFLRQTALFNAIGAAFQRAPIYRYGQGNHGKEQLKRDLEQHLRRIERQYHRTISSEQHFQTLNKVAHDLSERHFLILKNGHFRIGIAQKAVNIYLKLLWCYGWILEPPHCPIDSIVLAEAGDTRTKWTRMTDVEAYRRAIKNIRAHIRHIGSNLSLSEWELEIWNKRRETLQSQ